MKILVTGVKGQLGHDVAKEIKRRRLRCLGVDYDDFDITDKNSTLSAITKYTPNIVIHCAAYTAVDKAEDESELCRNVNECGTRHVAEACKLLDAKMIYISTDYVFTGHGEHFHMPYDPTGPTSIYGKTKLAGEGAVREILNKFFIVRTSWVFGTNGNNFVKTMMRIGKERDKIDVVCDQIGSPTYTADLAPLLCDIAATEKYDIYHATNEGTCSWAEFAQEIFRQSGQSTKVNPIQTSQYPARAARPLNSRLDKSCLIEAGFHSLPHWQDALRRFLA